jgi:putative endonuclease
MWFVYILLCADQSLYTGTTNDVAARFAAHLNGKGAKYTRSHKPVKIVYQEKMSSKSAALKRELEIKSWSREKKLSLILKK